MTSKQLSALGIPMNTWTTLENSWHGFFFMQEGVEWTFAPLSEQMYFEEDSGLLYVRYTDSRSTSKTKDNLHSIEITGKNLFARPFRGGVIDPTVGLYHNVLSFYNILEVF